jgi:mitochondrial chaperone BCS1
VWITNVSACADAHTLPESPVRKHAIMSRLFETLLNGQNQLASSGLLLMLVGGLGVYLREVPMRLWQWLVDQTTMSLSVKDDDAAFVWIKEWFLEQEFLKRVRRVDLDTTLRGQTSALIPAPGLHWFLRGPRPFWVYFTRSQEGKGYSARRTESFHFQTVGRDQAVLRAFVAEVISVRLKKEKQASYLYFYDDGWSYVQAYAPRSLDSVILASGEKERLLLDIERFRASRQRYRELGIPYHRGYLFYGPPGTGKSSLVSGLAAKFAMSIYVINLTEFNDRSLKSAMNEVPEGAVVLFEDVDCMKAGNARPWRGGEKTIQIEAGAQKPAGDSADVTLSGLLNVLDGFSAPDGVLFVMTSNRIEALDPALLRPGRIDYRLFMGRATDAQKIDLYRKFFPESTRHEARKFVESHKAAETMAEFQGLLLRLEQNAEAPELLEEMISS